MPRGDRTGPWGMGPMTGRAMGYCAGSSVPGFASAPGWWCRPRRGSGWGAGRRGRFWWGGLPPAAGTPYVPYSPAPPENEAGVLKAQIAHLENMLRAFKQRLEQIQGEQKERE